MIPFRTTLNVKQSDLKIALSDKVLCVGSCFSENIGAKLKDLQMPVCLNPFGISFNPMSMAESLSDCQDNCPFNDGDLYFDGELYHSWQHHGSFSSTDAKKTLEHIRENIQEAHNFLKGSAVILLTFGTAWVYELREQNRVVNNCHKAPAKMFRKRLLSVAEIVETYTPIISEFLKTGKKIIFTVSPIRHLRDGFVENNISKSVLILAVAQLKTVFGASIEYFPAYEILLDDLRDYRFYADDMIHPSDVAIEYIWSLFQSVYFDKSTHEKIKEINKLQKMSAHRSLHTETKTYEKFQTELSELKKKINP